MQVLIPITIICCVFFLAMSNRGYKPEYAYTFTILLFTVVAFSFQPNSGADLNREFAKLQSFRDLGWDFYSLLTSNIHGSNQSGTFQGLPVAALYYYIISKLPLKNFLPAISIFISYTLEFKMLTKIRKRFYLDKVDLFLLFLSVLCFRETYNMMSGIRNYLAFTIMGYFLYEDLVEKKSFIKCFIWYVIAALIHQIGWLVIGIRLICLIPSKKVKTVIAFCSLAWGNCANLIGTFFLKYSSIPLMNSLYVKIYGFTSSESSYADLSTITSTYTWYMISNVGIILMLIMAFFAWNRYDTCTISLGMRDNQDDRVKMNLRRGLIIRYKNKIIEKCASQYDYIENYTNVFSFVLIAFCMMFGALPYRIIFSRIGIIVRILATVFVAILLWYMTENDQMGSRQNIRIFLTIACAIKFVIMMLFLNRSMDFDLLGWFYYN